MIHTRKIAIEEEKLSLYTLARELESIAEEHATMLGVGGDVLLPQGITWVLIKREALIHEMPVKGQQVTIETWPGKTRHGFFPRRFRFIDEEGKLLIECACQWALMDINERTMITSKDFDLTGTKREGEQKAPASKVVFPELTKSVERVVKAEEIDRNGHLNNAHYLRWIDQILPEGFSVSELWIEYSKEILEGEKVLLCYEIAEDAVFVKGIAGGEDAFRIRLKK